MPPARCIHHHRTPAAAPACGSLPPRHFRDAPSGLSDAADVAERLPPGTLDLEQAACRRQSREDRPCGLGRVDVVGRPSHHQRRLRSERLILRWHACQECRGPNSRLKFQRCRRAGPFGHPEHPDPTEIECAGQRPSGRVLLGEHRQRVLQVEDVDPGLRPRFLELHREPALDVVGSRYDKNAR